MIWLTVRRDPRAQVVGELLDREVMSLEPFLEALPSMLVLQYMMRTDQDFFSSDEYLVNMSRAVYTTMFGMTLFLKNGPCFTLPRQGIFGIITWRFIVAFILNNFSLNIKYMLLISWPSVNMFFMAAFGGLVSLLSLHEGLGSWKSVGKIVLFCPPLVILPLFGFFTFGKPQGGAADIKGLALSAKWTLINMLGACLLSLVRYLSHLPHTSTLSLQAWLLQFPGADGFTHAKGVGLYLYCLFNTFFAVVLTLILLRYQLECGVLLPHLPGVFHVLQEGEVQPLIQPTPPTFTRLVR